MNDTDGKKPLGLGGNRPGSVKQSFSHGRTKSVVVETKRKKVVVPKPGTAPAKASGSPKLGDPSRRPAGISDAEMERRLKALQAAKAREAEETAAREAEEKAREEERERRRAELEAKEREEREREEALRLKQEEEERKAREAELRAQKKEEVRAKPAPKAEAPADPAAAEAAAARAETKGVSTSGPRKTDRDRDERGSPDRDSRSKGKGNDGRRAGKLSLSDIEGEGGRQRSLAAMKRKQEKARQKAMGFGQKAEKQARDVQLPETIVVSELANRMAERVADVIKSLMKMGMMVTANQTIDADTAELVIDEFGHNAVRVSDSDVEQVIDTVEDKAEDLQSRPPIITIMGHVDHGKTSLLDAIRHANVVSGEAGGITQHIGAYQVTTDSGAVLTFLDTPGHAAFTSMRARGAQVTDIVVLVVAADDAVMPQTIEAINHARAAKVPMIVAINKIDKPSANAQKVRTDLLQHEVVVEEMGGEVQTVEVSAKTGKGLDNLLEAIALQAEILELKANPKRAALGAVIEAKLDIGRGPVATVLVQNGTLKRGDIFVVGEQWGKVRALINDHGDRVDEAGPSVPVEVLGLNGTPEAGDVLNVVETEAQAREIADYRIQAAKDKRAAAGAATTLEQLMAKAKADESRVRPKQSSRRSKRSATKRCGCASSTPASVRSPRATLALPRRAKRRSSASTSVRTPRPAPRRTRRASRSATTRSSTIWSTTSKPLLLACSRQRSANTSSATPRSRKCSGSRASARLRAASSPRALRAARPACACCATTSWYTRARSRRSSASRTRSKRSSRVRNVVWPSRITTTSATAMSSKSSSARRSSAASDEAARSIPEKK